MNNDLMAVMAAVGLLFIGGIIGVAIHGKAGATKSKDDTIQCLLHSDDNLEQYCFKEHSE